MSHSDDGLVLGTRYSVLGSTEQLLVLQMVGNEPVRLESAPLKMPGRCGLRWNADIQLVLHVQLANAGSWIGNVIGTANAVLNKQMLRNCNNDKLVCCSFKCRIKTSFTGGLLKTRLIHYY